MAVRPSSYDVVVLVPMLGRAWAVEPLVESLAQSDPNGRARIVFLTSPDDVDVHAAVDASGAHHLKVGFDPGPGDYALKINLGASRSSEPWIFTGASDLRFQRGWIETALLEHDRFPRFSVIGTNDLGNALVKRGRHSTHSFVRRDYLEEAVVDDPGALYSTAYDHNFCDTELVDFAIVKGRFRPAKRSIVEHFHPDWRKAETDETYRRGKAGFRADQLLFAERQRLWRGRSREEARALARGRVR